MIKNKSSCTDIAIIVGSRINATSYADATDRILQCVNKGKGGYVCAANVHMVMEGYDNVEFQNVINQALLVTPDGVPLVWMLRRLGFPKQGRVYGPSLMLELCKRVENSGVAIGLYGGTQECLDKLRISLLAIFPNLRINYYFSPPFRALTDDEDAEIVTSINDAGIGILFVGLGCPKQERWMAAHASRIKAVQIGVGAAFAFHAGLISQAPGIFQRLGCEWLYRLIAEPRRLWFRYLYHNPRFICLATLQLLKKIKATA